MSDEQLNEVVCSDVADDNGNPDVPLVLFFAQLTVARGLPKMSFSRSETEPLPDDGWVRSSLFEIWHHMLLYRPAAEGLPVVLA